MLQNFRLRAHFRRLGLRRTSRAGPHSLAASSKSMTRYAYNRQVSPPAPFVHVTISEPDLRAALNDIPAQVDTAADMTVLPQSLVDRLGLVQLDRVPAVGFDGH